MELEWEWEESIVGSSMEYMFMREPLRMADAQASCMSIGAHLWEPRNLESNAALAEGFRKRFGDIAYSGIWTGIQYDPVDKR